jgi:hypothetical protein
LQQGGAVKNSILSPETGSFRSLITASALLAVTSLIASCSKPPPEKSSSAPTIASAAKPVASASARPPGHPQTGSSAGPSTGAPGDVSDLKITWKNPEKWVPTAAGGVMQKARYLTPPSDGDKEGATLTVFYFGPGMGGSVEANIDRWIGQFKNVPPNSVKKSERAKDKLTHHIVEIPEGTFEAGMMAAAPNEGPKPGWGMLGAVVEAPSGKYFFKLVGPKRTIAANKAAFDGLLESIQEKP